MASGQRNLQLTKSPSQIIYVYPVLLEAFVDVVSKHAIGTITLQGTITYFVQYKLFVNIYVNKRHFASLSIIMFV